MLTPQEGSSRVVHCEPSRCEPRPKDTNRESTGVGSDPLKSDPRVSASLSRACRGCLGLLKV